VLVPQNGQWWSNTSSVCTWYAVVMAPRKEGLWYSCLFGIPSNQHADTRHTHVWNSFS